MSWTHASVHPIHPSMHPSHPPHPSISSTPSNRQAYIFYKRFLRLAVDCIPEHAAYKDANFRRDKNWLVGERRVALDALATLNRDITAEIARHYLPVPPPVVPPPSNASSKEDLLELRLRNLRGGDAPSSKQLHSPLGGGADTLHDDLVYEDDDNNSAILSGTVIEPSAPPLFLDDGPEGSNSLPEGGRLNALDIDTAFQSLRLCEDDDPKVMRYYPTVLSPQVAPKPPAKEGSAIVSPQQDWLSRRGMLRRLLLPSGLVGKFLQIAESNSRKVCMQVLVTLQYSFSCVTNLHPFSFFLAPRWHRDLRRAGWRPRRAWDDALHDAHHSQAGRYFRHREHDARGGADQFLLLRHASRRWGRPRAARVDPHPPQPKLLHVLRGHSHALRIPNYASRGRGRGCGPP